jgi:selenoprotein W-related protein
LAADIEQTYPDADVVLVESSGGVFEVSLNGELIFSKVQSGRHATPGEVLRLLKEHFGH